MTVKKYLLNELALPASMPFHHALAVMLIATGFVMALAFVLGHDLSLSRAAGFAFLGSVSFFAISVFAKRILDRKVD